MSVPAEIIVQLKNTGTLWALYVICDGVWYNILTGRPDGAVTLLAAPMPGVVKGD